MVKFVRVLLMISGLVIMQGAPLYADDSRQEEMVSAEEALSTWVRREIKRTRKIVQIVGRVKDNASCDRAIAAIRKLYLDARTKELLDPCPDDSFSYEQLDNKTKRQFEQLIKLLRKKLLCIHETHVDSCSEHMYSSSPPRPRNCARSNSDAKVSSGRFGKLCIAISDYVLVCDEIFPLDE